MPAVPGLSEFSILARGGYATVYRAVQDSVGREVAVKVENRTLDSDRDQRRFLREARAAGRMSSHPHVVDLFDVGVTVEQQPYLIMELCDGSYADRMRTAPLTAIEARDLGVKIADALAHSHENGVLHRDVKPANILHSRFNPAVLADFGLAVLAEARDASVTLEVLTPAYAPPEMFRHAEPSPAVDIYALCATLYAVMRGMPPRWREDRNPGLVTIMEMFAEPIPELPGVPTELIDILRAGMANDPGSRPYAWQMRDMLAALPLPLPPGASPVSGAPVSGASVPGTPVSGAPVSAGSTSSGQVSGGPVSGGPVSGAPFPGIPTSGPPHPDQHPEPPPAPTDTGGSGRRRRRWWLGGLATVMVITSVFATGWVALGGPSAWRPWGVRASPTATPRADTDPSPATTPVRSPAPDPSDTPGAVALPGCLVPLPVDARCPETPECFGAISRPDGLRVAERVECGRPHTWETFAVGELPRRVTRDDLVEIRTVPQVRALCNRGIFRAVTLRLDDRWQIDVVLPAAKGLNAGDRSFRCVAGIGRNQLTGPTLARGGPPARPPVSGPPVRPR